MNKKIVFLISLLTIFVVPIVIRADVLGTTASLQQAFEVIGGTLVVIGWLIAGILYLTAAGSPERTGLAKKALIAAIVGTILVIISSQSCTFIKELFKLDGTCII